MKGAQTKRYIQAVTCAHGLPDAQFVTRLWPTRIRLALESEVQLLSDGPPIQYVVQLEPFIITRVTKDYRLPAGGHSFQYSARRWSS